MSVYLRRFDTGFELRDFTDDGDGRTVYGRVVPFNEPVSFVDQYDNNRVKQEMFLKGALARQTPPGAWSRVALSFQHDDGFTNTIGYGRQLQELDDGAYATFKLYEADASKAREMMTNTYDGLSLEFEPKGLEETDRNNVILRKRVHVRRVGITNDPAYKSAEVLALRERSIMDTETPHLDAVLGDLAKLRGMWVR
jgi:uncharacterized protein